MSHIANDNTTEALSDYLAENCTSECNHQKDCYHEDKFYEMLGEGTE